MGKTFTRALVCATFLLASCGGDDGAAPPSAGGGGATPTPSPSPPPTYTTFDALAADTTFDTSCTGYYRPAPGGEPVELDTVFGSGLAVAYDAAKQSWSVAGSGFRHEFTQDDRDAQHESLYVLMLPAGELITFGLAAETAAYAREMVLVSTSSGAPYQVVSCILGISTQAGDEPTAATSYVVDSLIGNAYVNGNSYDLSASTAQLSYNPATHRIVLDVTMAGRQTNGTDDNPTPDTVVTLGTLQSAADPNVTARSFEGALVSSTLPNFEGRFGGAFFGPQGTEVALVIRFTGVNEHGSEYSGNATLIAKKTS